MSQQINLYSPSLLPEREWVTGRNLTFALAGLVLFLGLSAAAVQYRLASASDRATMAARDVDQLKSKVQTATQALAGVRLPADKDPELMRLQRAVNDREQVVALLEQGSPLEGQSFAEYFRGLARQSLPGLWLTGFSLEAKGEGMEIRGRMTDQSLLPEYIRRLNREKVFSGREFAALDVGLPEAQPPTAVSGTASLGAVRPNPNYVNFVLKPLRFNKPPEREAGEGKGAGQ